MTMRSSHGTGLAALLREWPPNHRSTLGAFVFQIMDNRCHNDVGLTTVPSKLCGIQPKKARDEGGRDENCRVDLHAKQQTIAMVDTETGEFSEKTLLHEGNAVGGFYASGPARAVTGLTE